MPNLSDPNDPAWIPPGGWEYIIHFDDPNDLNLIDVHEWCTNYDCCRWIIDASWLKTTIVRSQYPYNFSCVASKAEADILYAAAHYLIKKSGVHAVYSRPYFYDAFTLGQLNFQACIRGWYYYPGSECPYNCRLYHQNSNLGEIICEGVVLFDGPSKQYRIYNSLGLVKTIDVDYDRINTIFFARAKFVDTLYSTFQVRGEVDWIAWRTTPPIPPADLEPIVPTKIHDSRYNINMNYSAFETRYVRLDGLIKQVKGRVEGKNMLSTTHTIQADISAPIFRVIIETQPESIPTPVFNTTSTGLTSSDPLDVTPDNVILAVAKSSSPINLRFTDINDNPITYDWIGNTDVDGDGQYELSVAVRPTTPGTLKVQVEPKVSTASVQLTVYVLSRNLILDAELVIVELP